MCVYEGGQDQDCEERSSKYATITSHLHFSSYRLFRTFHSAAKMSTIVLGVETMNTNED